MLDYSQDTVIKIAPLLEHINRQDNRRDDGRRRNNGIRA
jgi:hypothetical protein